jgi:hypothetical protein
MCGASHNIYFEWNLLEYTSINKQQKIMFAILIFYKC